MCKRRELGIVCFEFSAVGEGVCWLKDEGLFYFSHDFFGEFALYLKKLGIKTQ